MVRVKKYARFILLMTMFLLFGAKTAFGEDGLQVHFIDVGQADACLIICDGHTMLIDGGNSSDSRLIYSYLKQQNIRFLNYIVATHADADHVGGLSGAVAYAGSNIGTVFAPYKENEKERFQKFKEKLSENGKFITVPRIGGIYRLGGAKFQVLAGAGESSNSSIVLRLTYGEHSFLFMGDAGSEEEKEILEAGFPLESTVLKVGHHGSDTSTCYPFLRETYPQYAVISVGAGNSYGHPTEEVLSRLRDCGTKVFRTDKNGMIVFESDGKTLSYKTKKPVDFETNLIADNPLK